MGQTLRRVRSDRGYSQEDFANYINMNRGYYGTIERGEANVTTINLLRIVRGLEVTPNDLLPPETYAAPKTEPEK